MSHCARGLIAALALSAVQADPDITQSFGAQGLPGQRVPGALAALQKELRTLKNSHLRRRLEAEGVDQVIDDPM